MGESTWLTRQDKTRQESPTARHATTTTRQPAQDDRKATPDTARQGKARQGKARQGKARQGNSTQVKASQDNTSKHKTR